MGGVARKPGRHIPSFSVLGSVNLVLKKALRQARAPPSAGPPPLHHGRHGEMFSYAMS